MAGVPVTLNGVICDLYGRTISGPVKVVGELIYSVPNQPPGGGGGSPPEGGGPVDPGYGVPVPPLTIWGGRPGPWGGSWVPPQPDVPPPEGPVGEDGFIKSPPPNGGWGYHPTYGWMLDPGPGEAGPK